MLPRSIGQILRLIDPKTLVFVAALLAAIGLVSGYVEVHEQADRTLALRQGPPPKTALQDFRMVEHVGPADEVFLQAEADFSRATVLTRPGSEPLERALVVPLFGLSDTGAARIQSREPGAGALSAQVSRRTGAGDDKTAPAIGMMFYPLEAGMETIPDAAALSDAVFGPGARGTVVEVNGLHLDPGEFSLIAHGALSVLGVSLSPSHLTVRPFAGDRMMVLSTVQSSQAHRALFMTAMVLVAVSAIVSILRGRAEETFADEMQDEPGSDAPAAAHPHFAPIPSQREIIEAERARIAEPAEPHWAMTLLRSTGRGALQGGLVMAMALGTAIAGVARLLRSRPARREDEVL